MNTAATPIGRVRPRTSAVAALGALILACTGLLAAAWPARADTRPPAGVPATVSADPLPTVQINGVVWSQVTVGNTVYATGNFTTARPAGSPPGSNQVSRKYLLAYSLSTGQLITAFNHSLNAQGVTITASSNGSRVYVGGDFTQVDGVNHNRIAAFDTATGALVSSFSPMANSSVRAITATNSTVYFGGDFTAVSGVARQHLAAATASSGALTSWAPKADNGAATAMILTPDLSRVIVGGHFSTLNGQSARGLGALAVSNGATLSWAANRLIQDYGANAAITFLRTDGQQIYGGGYVFGSPGNLEGVFAADPNSGTIRWIEDCHGDTYDTFSTGQVVYAVAHEHYCGTIGAWPQTNPWTFRRATAFTTNATGTITHNPYAGYFDFFGNPRPTQVDWYPDLAVGSFTGQTQAAWSATGNGSYLALGGEFPSVNGTAQQGLVRFAVASIAPNKVAPKPSASLVPTVTSPSKGTARISWKATYDQDNQTLTYQVIRDGKTTTPAYTTTAQSTFWQLPSFSYTDSGLVSGSTHSYQIRVTDPFGNLTKAASTTVTIS